MSELYADAPEQALRLVHTRKRAQPVQRPKSPRVGVAPSRRWTNLTTRPTFHHQDGCPGLVAYSCPRSCFVAAAAALGIEAQPSRLTPADRARAFAYWRDR